MKNRNIAIVGATGAVGREFVGCIESRGVPLKSLKLLASARSAGQTQNFRGESLTIEALKDDSFDGVDIALFSAGSGISRQYAPIAVKAGAVDYLTKPADADAVEAALLSDKKSTALPPPPARPMSAERVRWEHIQRIFEQCDRNVSETARRLGMHRRTLQRILAKYAPKENADS